MSDDRGPERPRKHVDAARKRAAKTHGTYGLPEDVPDIPEERQHLAYRLVRDGIITPKEADASTGPGNWREPMPTAQELEAEKQAREAARTAARVRAAARPAWLKLLIRTSVALAVLAALGGVLFVLVAAFR